MLLPSAVISKHASGATGIQAVVPSAVYQLDATVTGSYSGSGQSWLNMIQSPADGSTQATYDHWLGTTSSVEPTLDPVFVGVAGTSSNYWTMTGTCGFTCKNTQSAFLQNIPLSTAGQDFWLAMAFRQTTLAANAFIFDTSQNASTPGFRLAINITTGTNTLRLEGSGVSLGSTTSTYTLTAGTDYLFVGTYSHSTNTVNFYLNSRTITENHAYTQSANANKGTVAAAVGQPNGGAFGGGNGAVGRLYGISMGNTFCSNTDVNNMVTYYNALHGRTYA